MPEKYEGAREVKVVYLVLRSPPLLPHASVQDFLAYIEEHATIPFKAAKAKKAKAKKSEQKDEL